VLHTPALHVDGIVQFRPPSHGCPSAVGATQKPPWHAPSAKHTAGGDEPPQRLEIMATVMAAHEVPLQYAPRL